MAKPETVVDYDAWSKGYMPPSEHVLIDQLSYRGARVVLASDWGELGAVWIVVRGDRVMKPELRKSMRDLIALAFEEVPDCASGQAGEAVQSGPVGVSDSGLEPVANGAAGESPALNSADG